VIPGWKRKPFLNGKNYLRPGEYMMPIITRNIESIFIARGI